MEFKMSTCNTWRKMLKIVAFVMNLVQIQNFEFPFFTEVQQEAVAQRARALAALEDLSLSPSMCIEGHTLIC